MKSVEIIHKKAAMLHGNEWEQINLLNQKIIRSCLFDQEFFNGGCLKSTCDKAVRQAIEIGSTEVLLCFLEKQLIGYMIFYCDTPPASVQDHLQAYRHLGTVGYSDMLVVDPSYQKNGYAKQIRSLMQQIGKEAGVDVFMTFVRGLPIPNIPSLRSLRDAGAVCGKNLLILKREFDDIEVTFTDICLEMVYPCDERRLNTNSSGQVTWQEVTTATPIE
jgi:GNAT superfamily N-acetyltransferase